MLDRLRRRFGWFDTALTVHERVGAVGGGPLSSSMALAGFLSLFPLLVVAIAVLGFLSANDTGFPAEVVDQLGLTGTAKDEVLDVLAIAEDSRRAASVVGFAGLVWAGLGVVGTIEQALDATWQVKGRPGWKAKAVDLGWLLGAGAVFFASMALVAGAGELGGPAAALTVVLGVAVDVVLFLWMFRALTNVAVPWTDHLPGAIAGGVGLEVLKVVGGLYLPRAVSSSSALYGSLGVVFAILAWLAIGARLVVYCSALNVVRHERRHGTVTVEIQVPRIAGEAPLVADRGGAVAETASDQAGAEPEAGGDRSLAEPEAASDQAGAEPETGGGRGRAGAEPGDHRAGAEREAASNQAEAAAEAGGTEAGAGAERPTGPPVDRPTGPSPPVDGATGPSPGVDGATGPTAHGPHLRSGGSGEGGPGPATRREPA